MALSLFLSFASATTSTLLPDVMEAFSWTCTFDVVLRIVTARATSTLLGFVWLTPWLSVTRDDIAAVFFVDVARLTLPLACTLAPD